MNKNDKLNEIFDKFKDKFSGAFHTVLWEIMINENRKGKEAAFVSNYENGGLRLGIADKDISGYTPTPVMFVSNIKHDEAEVIIDELNREVFELSDEQAIKIQLSSYRKQ